MSKAWSGGSTAAWRALRLMVFDRDGWVCQLCGKPIPRWARKPHPLSAEAHHTRDRRLVGDDPRFIVASHRECNLAAGQPGRRDGEHEVPGWLAARLGGDGGD